MRNHKYTLLLAYSLLFLSINSVAGPTWSNTITIPDVTINSVDFDGNLTAKKIGVNTLQIQPSTSNCTQSRSGSYEGSYCVGGGNVYLGLTQDDSTTCTMVLAQFEDNYGLAPLQLKKSTCSTIIPGSLAQTNETSDYLLSSEYLINWDDGVYNDEYKQGFYNNKFS